MKLEIPDFADGSKIPPRFAFAKIAEVGHVELSDNHNPELRWSEAPAETRSYVVLCHDRDVPSRPDDVNQEGREVPADLPRVDFFHWVLIDIPATVDSIPAASDSSEVTPRGKSSGATAIGVRGLNDYTNWFAGDPDMEGRYAGYDGPGPPWNDSILHHYTFAVYALDVANLGLGGDFTGSDVRRATGCRPARPTSYLPVVRKT